MIRHHWLSTGPGIFACALARKLTKVSAASALTSWVQDEIFDRNVCRHLFDFIGVPRLIQESQFRYSPNVTPMHRGQDPRLININTLRGDQVYGLLFNRYFSRFQPGDDVSEDHWLEWRCCVSANQCAAVDLNSHRVAIMEATNWRQTDHCIVYSLAGEQLRRFPLPLRGSYSSGFFHHPLSQRLYRYNQQFIDSTDWCGRFRAKWDITLPHFPITSACAHPTQPQILLLSLRGDVARIDLEGEVLQVWSVSGWTPTRLDVHLFVDSRCNYVLMRYRHYLDFYSLDGHFVCQYQFGQTECESKNCDMAVEVQSHCTRLAWLDAARQTIHLLCYQ